jgi:sulfite exporter TauE/SafE
MTLLFESFVFGAVNSLHCACMCGPLALAFGGSARTTGIYQCARIGAYALVGAILGGTGQLLGSDRIHTPAATVAIVLAVGLVLLAVAGERSIRLPFVDRVMSRLHRASQRTAPGTRAGLLGAATPLLPCGLLWSTYLAAGVAGSTFAGMQVMLGFALGAVPLLAFAQLQTRWLARKFSPRTLQVVQRVAMLAAAGLLVWRAAQASTGGCCDGAS